jgi:hypothetical protein
MGLSVWVEDEAGPYQTIPYPGESWQPEGQPVHQRMSTFGMELPKC